MSATPVTASAPLLVVQDLRTTFHTPRGDVRAVDGVSLTLAPGETVGLVGESGSGKSVFGRTAMGLITNSPTVTVDGTVTLAGHDLHAMDRKARRKLWGPEVAMVFQDPMTSLNPVKLIGTHLTETLRYQLKCSRTEANSRAVDLLNQVGIPEPRRRMKQYPHELSGGMRQRVVIAMALACEPRLLIADEPTTALDVTVQKQILDLLASLTRDLGMAMILVSHDLGAVAGRTDRSVVMYAGRVAETGGTADVFARPSHPYTEALLGSIPQIEDDPHTLLSAIEGSPPDMVAPPAGCRFSPRCNYATDVCRTDLPVLEPLASSSGASTRSVACHLSLQPKAALAAAQPVTEGGVHDGR